MNGGRGGYQNNRGDGRRRTGGFAQEATAQDIANNQDRPIQLMRTSFKLNPKENTGHLYQYRVEFQVYKEETGDYVLDSDVQQGDGDYVQMRNVLFHKALSKMENQDGAVVDQSKRNKVLNQNFDAMTFISQLSTGQFHERSDETDVEKPPCFYVEWEQRGQQSDPRRQDDEEDEDNNNNNNEPQNSTKYRVIFEEKRVINRDQLQQNSDTILVFTHMFRRAVPGDVYLSTISNGTYVLKSDIEKLLTPGGGTSNTMMPVGRSGLMLIRGWKVSVGKSADNGMFLNVDIANEYLQQDNIQMMMERIARVKINGPVADRMKQQIDEQLVGKYVITAYNGRKYRIDSIDWDTTAGSKMPEEIQKKFKKKNSMKAEEPDITYIDYCEKLYGVKRRDINANCPMLVAKIKKREGDIFVKLVPSLCFKRGLTQEQDSDGFLRSQMCKSCTMAPRDRLQFIDQFVQKMSQIMREKQNCMIKLDTQPIVQSGLTLKKPLVEFLDETKYFADARQHNWRDAQKGKTLSTTGTLDYPNFGLLASGRDIRKATDFVDQMRRVAGPMNVNFGRESIMEARGNDQRDFITAYRNAAGQRGHGNGYDMVLIKLPSDKKAPQALYDSIKGEMTFGEFACANQCISSATDGKRTQSKATAVVAQMAGPKKSNKLWSIVEVKKNLVKELCPKDAETKYPMVMALDEFQKMHCLTFTVDGDLCDVKCAFHQSAEDNMGDSAYKRLLENAFERYFNANNNHAPNGILFYRVGVSDSQLNSRKTESSEIVSFVDNLYTRKEYGKAPMMEMVQINLSATKLFDSRGSDNAPPGSILDVSPEETIMLSHKCGIRGATCVPVQLIRLQNQ